MLEYGESYLKANKAWLKEAKKRMSPAAYALAVEMAKEQLREEEEE